MIFGWSYKFWVRYWTLGLLILAAVNPPFWGCILIWVVVGAFCATFEGE